jgi:uncharacterized protein YxeA
MIDPEYLKVRRIAAILTLIILVIGSILYFSTSVAERNNDMMYKQAYGENVTLEDTNTDAGSDMNVKTDTSRGKIFGKQTLV